MIRLSVLYPYLCLHIRIVLCLLYPYSIHTFRPNFRYQQPWNSDSIYSVICLRIGWGWVWEMGLGNGSGKWVWGMGLGKGLGDELGGWFWRLVWGYQWSNIQRSISHVLSEMSYLVPASDLFLCPRNTPLHSTLPKHSIPNPTDISISACLMNLEWKICTGFWIKVSSSLTAYQLKSLLI